MYVVCSFTSVKAKIIAIDLSGRRLHIISRFYDFLRAAFADEAGQQKATNAKYLSFHSPSRIYNYKRFVTRFPVSCLAVCKN